MNETNKFKDAYGDSIQAVDNGLGSIEIITYGEPSLSSEKAIEFAKQLIELAEEVKGKQ